MHANNLAIDHGTDGKVVENAAEVLPEFDVVAPLAFVKEAVDPAD